MFATHFGNEVNVCYPLAILTVEGNGTPLQYSCLENPMDCSLPGSSVHGIFQARVLEWGAIAFYG